MAGTGWRNSSWTSTDSRDCLVRALCVAAALVTGACDSATGTTDNAEAELGSFAGQLAADTPAQHVDPPRGTSRHSDMGRPSPLRGQPLVHPRTPENGGTPGAAKSKREPEVPVPSWAPPPVDQATIDRQAQYLRALSERSSEFDAMSEPERENAKANLKRQFLPE